MQFPGAAAYQHSRTPSAALRVLKTARKQCLNTRTKYIVPGLCSAGATADQRHGANMATQRHCTAILHTMPGQAFTASGSA
jgi:hypothetical protein